LDKLSRIPPPSADAANYLSPAGSKPASCRPSDRLSATLIAVSDERLIAVEGTDTQGAISFAELLASAERIVLAESDQAEADARARAAKELDLFQQTHKESQVCVMLPIGGVLMAADGQFETTVFGSFAPDFDWSAAWSLVYELEELAEEAREWWPRPNDPPSGSSPSLVARAIRFVLQPVSEGQRVDSERRRHSDAAFGLTTWVFKALREEENRHTGTSEEPSTIFSQKLAQIKQELGHAKLRLAAGMQRSAQTRYWYGAVLGAGFLAVLCAMIGIVFLLLGTQAFYGVAFAAGGIGAMVSVLQRMSTGRLKLDTSASRDLLELFGAVRPMIGAIFGIVIAAAIFGGLVPAIEIPKGNSLGFFTAVGFLAGFNERWAQDMLKSSADQLQPPPAAAQQEPVPAPSTDLRKPSEDALSPAASPRGPKDQSEPDRKRDEETP
jgi:hypothetical protein